MFCVVCKTTEGVRVWRATYFMMTMCDEHALSHAPCTSNGQEILMRAVALETLLPARKNVVTG